MLELSRRHYLKSIGVVSSGAIAGCTMVEPPKEEQEKTAHQDDPIPGDPDKLRSWERTIDCGERSRMYDSIIRVQYVKERLRDDYHPVQFSDIPEKEQQLLHPVIEEGGYQTCDVPPEFSDLVARLMENARKQQNDHLAYIEYRDTYYGLYIERADEVYSY